MLNNESVRIVRDIPPDITSLYSDREKLRQIILNLLGNAVKFTDHGEIRISASQENGDFKLTVADTGIGIDQADITEYSRNLIEVRLTSDGKLSGHGFGTGDRSKAGRRF